MKPKRDRVEIINTILVFLMNKPNAKLTHILYKANLSHAMMNDYLFKLKYRGYYEIIDGEYRLTDKGLKFIKSFDMMKEFLEDLRKV